MQNLFPFSRDMTVLKRLEADMVGGVAACEVGIHVIGAIPLDHGQLHVRVGKVVGGEGERATVVRGVVVLHPLDGIIDADACVDDARAAVVGETGVARQVLPAARVLPSHQVEEKPEKEQQARRKEPSAPSTGMVAKAGLSPL